MATGKKSIVIDESKCDGCGVCIPNCHEGALKLVNGKAKVVVGLCDNAGACIGHCPRGAISFRDEESRSACGCPGARVMSLAKEETPAPPGSAGPARSELAHWPVQLRLVPPEAPFLQDADLLIAADCVPCAYADFHRVLLKGKALLVGCPKFDDLDLYRRRLEAIIGANRLKSITYAHMEVPCCLGLKRVIEDAIAASGKTIVFHDVIITISGELRR